MISVFSFTYDNRDHVFSNLISIATDDEESNKRGDNAHKEFAQKDDKATNEIEGSDSQEIACNQ